jgi:hypothetical protein
VAYYPFNGNADDESGNGNTGVPINTTLTSDRFGMPGKGMYFNGTDAYILVANSPSIANVPNLTVSAWVQPDSWQTDSSYGVDIASKIGDDGTTFSWNLSIVPTGELRPHGFVGFWNYFDCSSVIQKGSWYHVAMVYDGAHLTGFVNGQADGAIPLSGFIAAADCPLRIGAYSPVLAGNHLWFSGKIDDVRIYNRALSDQEVQELYAYESTFPFQNLSISGEQVKFQDSSKGDSFSVNGQFTLAASSPGYNPLTDSFSIQFGSATLVVPSGSFSTSGNSSFAFNGQIGTALVQVQLTQIATTQFGFQVSAKALNLAGTQIPVPIQLTAGVNVGSGSVPLRGVLNIAN